MSFAACRGAYRRTTRTAPEPGLAMVSMERSVGSSDTTFSSSPVWLTSHRRSALINDLFTADCSHRDAIEPRAWHQGESSVDGVVLNELQVWTRRSRYRLHVDRGEPSAVLRDDGP